IFAGTTTLAGTTTMQGNQAGSYGGGIFVNPGATLIIAETCRITRNTASPGRGGGIFNNGGTGTPARAHPSPLVGNNRHENCAGTVAKCAATPVSCPP